MVVTWIVSASFTQHLPQGTVRLCMHEVPISITHTVGNGSLCRVAHVRFIRHIVSPTRGNCDACSRDFCSRTDVVGDKHTAE